MKDGEIAVANNMKVNGENKSDIEVVEKILRSNTPKFNYVVCSIEEAQDTGNISSVNCKAVW